MEELIAKFGLGETVGGALAQLRSKQPFKPIAKTMTAYGAVRSFELAPNLAGGDLDALFAGLRRQAEAGEIEAAMVVYLSRDRRHLCVQIEARDDAPVALASALSVEAQALGGGPALGRPERVHAEPRIFLDADAPLDEDWTRVFRDVRVMSGVDLVRLIDKAREMLEIHGALAPFAHVMNASGAPQLFMAPDLGAGDERALLIGALQSLAAKGEIGAAALALAEPGRDAASGRLVILLEAAGFDPVVMLSAYRFERRPRLVCRPGSDEIDEEASIRGRVSIAERRVMRAQSEIFL